MAKQIRLNAVEMANPVQDNAGLWTYGDSGGAPYKDLNYWMDLARLLEESSFDALFFADILGVYDVYQNSRDTAIREGLYIPINDPSYAIPAMAAVTKHLGFVLTASLTYEHPYTLARKMSTLDHLTNGRMGWNMVTSNLTSAALNFGLDEQISHDERYERGEEYLDVCYKLWQSSWEADAVIKDKGKRIYADPAKVHAIQHEGQYFSVPGIYLCEPSPQRTPVLFQAGSSERGRAFAARHAECIFLNAMTAQETKYLVDDVRQRAEKYGRNPADLYFFPKLNPVVAATQEEAEDKLAHYLSHASTEGALCLLSAWTGMDFAKFNANELLAFIQKGEERNGSSYFSEFFGRNYSDQSWTKEELAKYFAFGGVGSLLVGTPAHISDQMEAFMEETGVDGFNIAYATRDETLRDFGSQVVPELQRRGRISKAYSSGTLREKLFGKSPYLPAEHPGGAAAWHIQQT